ncbi:MAG: hypothetical protein ABFS32_03340 [Bacteroidota bacterium]
MEEIRKKQYRSWLMVALIAACIPFLLFFDDSFGEGFGPFYLVLLILIFVPVFFGMGALTGWFIDKARQPETTTVFYRRWAIGSGLLSVFLLWGFWPRQIQDNAFVHIFKTIVLNPYHIPLFIALITFGVSIYNIKKLNDKD